MNNKIEELIQRGLFSSRSDFGVRAVQTMLNLHYSGDHYMRVITEFLHYFTYEMRQSTYLMPQDIQRKFNKLYQDMVMKDKKEVASESQ